MPHSAHLYHETVQRIGGLPIESMLKVGFASLFRSSQWARLKVWRISWGGWLETFARCF
jgi:hypothetical protein